MSFSNGETENGGRRKLFTMRIKIKRVVWSKGGVRDRWGGFSRLCVDWGYEGVVCYGVGERSVRIRWVIR